jgi:hypothetical protein
VGHNALVTYCELLQTTLARGMPVEKALEFLRGSGASPAEAAKAVQETTGASFEEARALVQRSRAWSGPRSGVQPAPRSREWYGAIGQHGRSGHGAASVLPHLTRQTLAHTGPGNSGR